MPTILIVDDDALMRDVLRKTLVRAGYEVEDASDGTAALHAYQRQPRNLVITDIVMADGEGLDTIRAISGGGLGQSDDYLKLAAKLGAAEVLAKPFSGPEVLAVVASVLGESSDKDA